MAGKAELFTLLCISLVLRWAASSPLQPPHQDGNQVQSSPVLRVAAFNVEIFGVSKMDKPDVVVRLIELLLRHDLCLFQEIRDKSETAIYELMDLLNRETPDDPYSISLSERLGRTSSKEQYAYIYKSSKVEIVETYQWPDVEDIFERPPYVARFKTKDNVLREFGFIGIHVKPSDAVAEVDALTDVYDGMVKKWQLEDFIIGGDFNADCNYIRASHWPYIRLRTQDRFQWLIGDDVDTTIAESSCCYDRMVITGSLVKYAYVHGSALAYRFDDEWGLTYQEAKDVSDHVPTEIDII